jgi:hypothetical protein
MDGETIAAHAARHRQRLDDVRALSEAEGLLRSRLEAALASLSPPPRPSWWLRVLELAGLVELPPVKVPLEAELWRHHEATLEQLRAIGHHVDAVRHDQRLIAADIAELQAMSRQLAEQRGAEAARQTTARARGDVVEWVDGGASALEDRVAKLLAQHQAVAAALPGLVGSIEALHAQGRAATDALAEQIAEAADVLAAHTGDEALRIVRESLGELALAADSCAVTLSRDLGGLDERLQGLDDDAQHRLAARAEVEDLSAE